MLPEGLEPGLEAAGLGAAAGTSCVATTLLGTEPCLVPLQGPAHSLLDREWGGGSVPWLEWGRRSPTYMCRLRARSLLWGCAGRWAVVAGGLRTQGGVLRAAMVPLFWP